MNGFPIAFLLLLTASFAHSQEKPATAAINGVKGVKQEAVKSIKPAEPPTANPPPPPPNIAQTVNKVDGVNKVEGIKAAPPNAVKGIPPPPAATGAVSTIRAVKGVQGIIAPKQQNLEAALLIKQDGKGTPAGGGAEGGKGKAAAAALLSGPQGLTPAPPASKGDGRGAFQEFAKQTAPGS